MKIENLWRSSKEIASRLALYIPAGVAGIYLPHWYEQISQSLPMLAYYTNPSAGEIAVGSTLTVGGAAALSGAEQIHVRFDQIRESVLERIVRAGLLATSVAVPSIGLSYVLTGDYKTAPEVAAAGIAGYAAFDFTRTTATTIWNKIKKKTPETKREEKSMQLYRGTLAAIITASLFADDIKKNFTTISRTENQYCEAIDSHTAGRRVDPFFKEYMCPALLAERETGAPAAVLLAMAAVYENEGQSKISQLPTMEDPTLYFVDIGNTVNAAFEKQVHAGCAAVNDAADIPTFLTKMSADCPGQAAIIDERMAEMLQEHTLDTLVQEVRERVEDGFALVSDIYHIKRPLPASPISYGVLEDSYPFHALIYSKFIRLPRPYTIGAGKLFVLELNGMSWIHAACIEFETDEKKQRLCTDDSGYIVDGNAYLIGATDLDTAEQDVKIKVSAVLPGRMRHREYTIHVEPTNIHNPEQISLSGALPVLKKNPDIAFDHYQNPTRDLCSSLSIARIYNFAAEKFAAVECSTDGPVTAALRGHMAFQGANTVILNHPYGIRTAYFNLANVPDRSTIAVGQQIGTADHTAYFASLICNESCMRIDPTSLEILNAIPKEEP